MRKLGFIAFSILLAVSQAANAAIVHDTTHNHTGFVQVTGNAWRGVGSQVTMVGTSGYITRVDVPTQTFRNFGTPQYTPGFLELSLWYNDGPVDSSSSDPFVQFAPDGQAGPGTLIAKSRVTGAPTYPAGGNHNLGGITVTFAFDDVLQLHNPLGTLVNGSFTWSIMNFDSNGDPDVTTGGQRWGIYQSGDLFDPETEEFIAPGGTVVGTHQFGWINYGGPRVSPTPWESHGPTNNGGAPWEVTIFANPVPEPSTMVLGGFGFVALVGLAVRRKRSV